MRGLTFELSRHRWWDARARMAKMYRVPPAGPARPAVGARLERGVRHCSADYRQSCWGCHGQIASDNVREADSARTQFVFMHWDFWPGWSELLVRAASIRVKRLDTRVCMLKDHRIAPRHSRWRRGRARRRLLPKSDHFLKRTSRRDGLVGFGLQGQPRNRERTRKDGWMVFAVPNVRVKPAPTVGRAGPAGENVQGTAGRARVARRWGSA